MIITSEFFSFNVWEWFLHSSVLERPESDLSKINWLRGVILLNPIVLVPWGRFPLCHTPIRPISAFLDQISILIVGCVIMWSRGSHHWLIEGYSIWVRKSNRGYKFQIWGEIASYVKFGLVLIFFAWGFNSRLNFAAETLLFMYHKKNTLE
jgi:hypothetical protein